MVPNKPRGYACQAVTVKIINNLFGTVKWSRVVRGKREKAAETGTANAPSAATLRAYRTPAANYNTGLSFSGRVAGKQKSASGHLVRLNRWLTYRTFASVMHPCQRTRTILRFPLPTGCHPRFSESSRFHHCSNVWDTSTPKISGATIRTTRKSKRCLRGENALEPRPTVRVTSHVNRPRLAR